MSVIIELWMPIALAAVLVFVASSVIHMILPFHRNDFQKLVREAEVRGALRDFSVPPGDYFVPHARGPKDMGSDEYQAKLREGPVMMMTVIPNGPFAMGRSLLHWFVYCVVVGVFCAAVAGPIVPIGAKYMVVFHTVGLVAFAAYALAMVQDSIWFHRSWATTARFTIDGLVYALLTAGSFAALWPQVP